MKRISKFMIAVLVLGLLFAFMTATASASEMGWADSAEDLQTKIDKMADGSEIEIYCEGTVYIDKTVTFNKSGTIHFKGNPTFVSGVKNAYLFEVSASDVTVDFDGSTIQLADSNTWGAVNGAAVHLAGEHDKLCNANFYFGTDLKISKDNLGREKDVTESKGLTFFGGSETGVVTVDGDKCNVENCTFGNYYNDDDDYNGTITINANNCVVDRCTIEGASSWGGSAVYVTKGHSWNNIKNSTFAYCFAQACGNVFLNGSHNTVENCQLNHCVGDEYGGGIFVGGESCNILNNKFLDCRAEQWYFKNSVEGGAVYVDDVNCLIAGCDFTNCRAYDNAGAIFIYQHGCSIDGCTFTDCYASDYGGAAYVARNTYDIYFTNCTFTGCDSYYKDGTIYSQGSTAYNVSFDRCTFNTDADYETALYVWEDYTSIKNCNKFNNDVSITPVEYASRGPSASASIASGVEIPEGDYVIFPQQSGDYCFDISGGVNAKSNGDNLQLWHAYGENASSSNVFTIVRDKATDAYNIIAKHSGLYLDVSMEKGTGVDGANIYQWERTGGNNQAWVFELATIDGYYYIRALDGQYMDVSGANMADGANIYSWTFHGGENQMFRLVPASEVLSTGSVLSTGNVVVICVVAAAAVAGIAAAVVVSKKKKAVAEN